ncbi:ABC transporter substrate-binding protein [Streptomyces purpurogeneiscleroticus]|uniref:ABC transporter substrate-binding protein n=1 Tax=Streptomyces purpurogeneiscleroticus TaxID=68259 RepID=UPI001CBEFFDC|nr:ABC transporter substrate-binding protein [Streptomyces purpurogeneiscleroticus]MBZ4019944.1 iron transporter [Streptomyces purpurogeneiscleroticus]
MPVRRPAAALAALLALTLTGCGAQVEQAAPDDRGTAVTIENCGKKVTFDKVPERVVTNDVGITEIMFALGLEDRMAGFVMPDDKGKLSGVPWKDGYEKTKWLSKGEITKELAVDARADMVFAGWNYGFREGGLTPAALHKFGIESYLLTESCHNGRGSARGIMPPLEALYTDLNQLGKLFGVQDRAQKLIADFKGRVAEVRSKAPKGTDRPSVFLYDSGQDKPFTAGRYAAPDDIIAKAGGRSITHDLTDSWTTVGWETVVERNPEVIVICDYGDTTAEQKKQFLLNYKPLANVSAIKNRKIVTLDYADLVESPRNPAAIERLGSYLRR